MNLNGAGLNIFLVSLLPFLGVAQTPPSLLNIIQSDKSIEYRQQQIDSLLMAGKESLSVYELADIYHDLGNKWYFQNWDTYGRPSDLKQAIRSTKKSVQIKSNLRNIEDCSLSKSLYNLGFFLTLDNKSFEAITTYSRLIKSMDASCPQGSPDHDLILWAHRELGEQFRLTGEFYKAIDTYETLITLANDFEDLVRFRYPMQIYAHLQLARIYFEMNTALYFDKIRKHIKASENLLAESGIPCCQWEMRINLQFGNALLINKDYNEALHYNQNAWQFLSPEDSLNRAIVSNSIGLSLLNLEKDSLAYTTLQNAIALAADYADPYNNLGDYYTKQKDFERAMQHYQKAIDLTLGLDKNTPAENLPALQDFDFLPNKVPLLNHIVTKANGWVKFYHYDGNGDHLERALETFIMADQLVDLIRYESTEEQSKLFWREKGASLYMKAVEACHLLNRPKLAFHFMERNKALLLLEDLTSEEAKKVANLPNELAEREFNLKRALLLTENSIQQTDSNQKDLIVRLKDSLRNTKYRYAQFVDSLTESFPDYAKLKGKAKVMELNTLRENHVSSKKAVLHYILNEEQGFGLLNVSDTTLLFALDDVPKLKQDVEQLTTYLSDALSNVTQFQALSNEVFSQLFPADVYTLIQKKQLTLIPDYILQRIPFEILVPDTKTNHYLIEEIDLSYTYSASLLDYIKRTEEHVGSNYLGFAPVHFVGLGLPDLDFSKAEINGAAGMFNGETLVEDRASKQEFITRVGNHSIIHLATHADLGEEENPWIAFSDEKMYLNEIYATKNQANMVVLSGCNTARGALKRGEGVMSLARGFFYSGAKSVVSSLWPITDETGTDILINFYENLKNGNTKSEALRKAKLHYLENIQEEELKHPFYWAGIVVIGDITPLPNTKNRYWTIAVIAAILVVGFLTTKAIRKLR